MEVDVSRWSLPARKYSPYAASPVLSKLSHVWDIPESSPDLYCRLTIYWLSRYCRRALSRRLGTKVWQLILIKAWTCVFSNVIDSQVFGVSIAILASFAKSIWISFPVFLPSRGSLPCKPWARSLLPRDFLSILVTYASHHFISVLDFLLFPGDSA